MKKISIYKGFLIMTFGLLLVSSCKNKEATQAETTLPIEATATTPTDSTAIKSAAIAKDSLNPKEKEEDEKNEKE